MLLNVNGTTKELNYVVNGIDDAQDLIGNVITLEHDDEGHAIMDQDTFDWWVNYIELAQADEEKKAEMIETYGSDIVEDAINKAFEGINDYEDHHMAYQAAFEGLSVSGPTVESLKKYILEQIKEKGFENDQIRIDIADLGSEEELIAAANELGFEVMRENDTPDADTCFWVYK